MKHRWMEGAIYLSIAVLMMIAVWKISNDNTNTLQDYQHAQAIEAYKNCLITKENVTKSYAKWRVVQNFMLDAAQTRAEFAKSDKGAQKQIDLASAQSYRESANTIGRTLKAKPPICHLP